MSEEIQFIIGDVVQLNSGGPRLTVVASNGNFVKCQFFDKQDILHVKDFVKTTIKKIEKIEKNEIPMPIFKS